jgi:hypothetical protein
MKELLYIPSGKYVRFFSVPYSEEEVPYNSIETYVNQFNAASKLKLTIDRVVENIRHMLYTQEIYEAAEIPIKLHDNEDIPIEYFEIVE